MDKDKVSTTSPDDLAKAFTAEEPTEAPVFEGKEKSQKAPKDGKKKSTKFKISIVALVVGLIALVVGVVMLVLHLTQGPVVTDAEYLMLADEWTLSDGTNCASEGAPEGTAGAGGIENSEATNCIPSVRWKFTEVGKGTLTTNNHVNDYDFIWAIEDGKLKIETKWLYELENEYEYELKRGEKALVLKDGEKEIVFVGHFTDAE